MLRRHLITSRSARRAGLPARAARATARLLLNLYRAGVSPLMLGLYGPACRFEPTCSRYALDALTAHGLLKGTGLALRRLVRCRPGGPFGYDPVPPANTWRADLPISSTQGTE
ncbi:MAG TPA: membrane protein insertion efficiency factor YidD [Candidatus Binataceae bacterium]|jgi:putative membrane protein insertion efficiency factor|nr:membrane protein insertion efficiency factor YidD [Candidatus Binataceae bacterium]